MLMIIKQGGGGVKLRKIIDFILRRHSSWHLSVYHDFMKVMRT